jgi:hypothetical protein
MDSILVNLASISSIFNIYIIPYLYRKAGSQKYFLKDQFFNLAKTAVYLKTDCLIILNKR